MQCAECGQKFIKRTNAVTCSKACYRARHGRLGLADNETNAEILRRYQRGDLQADIARAVGLSYPAVRERLYLARRAGQLPTARRVIVALARPETAWERLRAELTETHRREFLHNAYTTSSAF